MWIHRQPLQNAWRRAENRRGLCSRRSTPTQSEESSTVAGCLASSSYPHLWIALSKRLHAGSLAISCATSFSDAWIGAGAPAKMVWACSRKRCAIGRALCPSSGRKRHSMWILAGLGRVEGRLHCDRLGLRLGA